MKRRVDPTRVTSLFATFIMLADLQLGRCDGGTVIGWGGCGQMPTPSNLTNVVQVVGGENHALALKDDGTVLMWGAIGSPAAPVPIDLPRVVYVAAGKDHSLALTASGTVAAWGANTSGQTDIPHGLTNVISVAAGSLHSLALRANGSVVAWGDNSSGQANVPPGLTNAVAVAGGGSHSLALLPNGTVVAWGANSNGQAVPPSDLTNAIAIAAGPMRSLALRRDGTVVMWGLNHDGTWGVPAGLSNVIAISAGVDGTLALKDDGTVVGWGYNFCGESTVPRELTNVVGIAAGGYFSLALVGDGTPALLSQVEQRLGAVGGAAQFRAAVAAAYPLRFQWRFNGVDVPQATNEVLIVQDLKPENAGMYSVLVSNAFGVAVSEDAALVVTPVLIHIPPESMVVYGGATAVFSVTAEGTQPLNYQWQKNGQDLAGATNKTLELPNLQFEDAGGYSVIVSNVFGAVGSAVAQLTVQPFIFSVLPTNQVAFLGGEASFSVGVQGTQPISYQWRFKGVDVDGATNSTFVVSNAVALQTGTYDVLVSNDYGQISTPAASLAVVAVAAWGSADEQAAVPADLTNVLAVAAGRDAYFALKADSTIVAWTNRLGWGDHGQTDIPPALSNVIALAAGTSHALALKSDGTVVAWGNNYFGQTNVPAGLSNVVAIAAGANFSIALKADGTLQGWGFPQTANVPPHVTDVVAVAAGLYHTVILKADGTVRAWSGDGNGFGEATVPPGLSNVVSIAAGAFHSLALRADGSVVGWGQNNGGQLTIPTDLGQVVALDGGDYFSAALRTDGSVRLWGGQTNVPAGLANVQAISANGGSSIALIGDTVPPLTGEFSNLHFVENTFIASFPSESGRTYRLEYVNSLSEGTWIPLPLVAGTGGIVTVKDKTGGDTQRFYRLRRW